ncbi:MAG: hypothetical protein K9N48_04005 [Verrucomicrobia bacterium]|nr:hypothetical protein [Verrucomicrobiota bacterium]MCF7709020.1 hypothetical protein [Verrucomicrobiota bacterium]
MRLVISALLLAVAVLSAASGQDGTTGIIKVLPHLLDLEGNNALSPSLFERDAYQAYLREHSEECSTIRFDVQWKQTEETVSKKLTLRLELRGNKLGFDKPVVTETKVTPPGWFSKWSSLTLDEKVFEDLGGIMAWRVRIIDGERVLAEKHSFMWPEDSDENEGSLKRGDSEEKDSMTSSSETAN